MQQPGNQGDSPAQHADRGKGPQGIDKAPGEEPSEDNVQFVQETQKGKKVDADLTNESERPDEQAEGI
jgi:hypothetical protein